MCAGTEYITPDQDSVSCLWRALLCALVCCGPRPCLNSCPSHSCSFGSALLNLKTKQNSFTQLKNKAKQRRWKQQKLLVIPDDAFVNSWVLLGGYQNTVACCFSWLHPSCLFLISPRNLGAELLFSFFPHLFPTWVFQCFIKCNSELHSEDLVLLTHLWLTHNMRTVETFVFSRLLSSKVNC